MQSRVLISSLLVVGLVIALNGISGAQGTGDKGDHGGRTTSDDEPQALQARLGSAITYQGQLLDGGVPAEGAYDLRFNLFDSAEGGTQVGGTITLEDQPAVNGVFTVPLDFGENVYNDTALWLSVAVRPGSSTDAFSTLSPRQRLTAAPFALYSASAWNLNGNAGTSTGNNFLGTTDSQPLILKTNNTEAMRIDGSGNVSVGGIGTNAKFEVSALAARAIALISTSSSRAVIGRLGPSVACPGTFGVGGCAGATGGTGVMGTSDSGTGVHGVSASGVAVKGASGSGRAIEGFSTSGIGVIGDSATRGVVGTLGRTSCSGTYRRRRLQLAPSQWRRRSAGKHDSGIGVYAFTGSNLALKAESASTSSGSSVLLAAGNGGNLFVGQTSRESVVRINPNGRGHFNGGTQVGGADYADSIATTDDPDELEPGDVLAIDPQQGNSVRRSREPNSRLVAGVYSTRPAVLGIGDHHIDDSLEHEVPVALVGLVPTKVSAENGPIAVGDLLVTSSLPGHAMKALPQVLGGVELYPTGAILGKAMEGLREGTGVINVLVTLR